MSVFKKHDKPVYKKELKLFFSIEDKNIKYNKKLDKKLLKDLKLILNMYVKKCNFQHLSKKEEKLYILSILRCSREILYNIIRRCNNYVNKIRICLIGYVCLLVSYKLVAGYDHEFENLNFLGFIYENFCQDIISKKKLLAIELKIIKDYVWDFRLKSLERLQDCNIE